MRFLPVVERELRSSSRRFGTYWVRTIVAAVVVAISGFMVMAMRDEQPKDVAEMIFWGISIGAMIYCLLVGIHSMADCISEEKREGTLGLLFLTDLKGYDVVLGKLVANSLNSFYGLASVLPVLAVTLMMGGITGLRVARVCAVLLNTMFFSMCVGIFASACSRLLRRANAFAFAIILFFTGVIPGLGAWAAWKLELRFTEWEFFLWTSPVYSYMSAQQLPVPLLSPVGFAGALAVIHSLGWFFLLLACFVAPRSWQDKPAGVRRLRWRDRLKNWSYGAAASRAAFRRRLLDANAFFWLAARERLKPAWVWTFLGVVACSWIWGWVKFGHDWLSEGIYITTALVLNAVFKNWFAAAATRQLSDDRKMGSLELLLSTPLTVREILRGQALALRRQFLGPVLIVLLAEIVMMVAGMRHAMDGADRTVWLNLWVWYFMVLLVADLIALYWVGMWMGLASKNPKRAYSDTAGRVLAMPWIVFSGFMLLTALLSLRGRTDLSWKFFLGFGIGEALALDLIFALWARHQLLTQFREVATRRFQTGASFWRRVFGLGVPGENVSTAKE
ncbi:MAG: ABC transporter permease [Pedosphaera sp.]|nr:ABC transporter permease [Pedosphaera sp.]